MDSRVLLDLAERCKKVTGPDRELDALIWCAVCPPDAEYGIDEWSTNAPRPPHLESVGLTLPQWLEKWPGQIEAMARAYAVLPYTASLDAAVTLVPEGWVKGLSDADNGDGLCELWLPDSVRDDIGVRGKTWPLALCAAALEARAASVDTHAKRGDAAQTAAPSPMSGAVASATADDRRPTPEPPMTSPTNPTDTPIERLKGAASFLVARIDELDWCGTMDDFAREWNGHVDPPLCRLRALLSTIDPIPSAGEGERIAEIIRPYLSRRANTASNARRIAHEILATLPPEEEIEGRQAQWRNDMAQALPAARAPGGRA